MRSCEICGHTDFDWLMPKVRYSDGVKQLCKECSKKISDSKKKELSKWSSKSKLRDSIYTRDGRKCKMCGSDKDLTIDHIQPRARGGSDEPSNLQVLCRKCNCKKQDK